MEPSSAPAELRAAGRAVQAEDGFLAGNGANRCVPALRPGRYGIAFALEGHESQDADVDVRANEVSEVTVTLTPR